jgi:hypothetical protein
MPQGDTLALSGFPDGQRRILSDNPDRTMEPSQKNVVSQFINNQ